jgi:hypothetical protein
MIWKYISVSVSVEESRKELVYDPKIYFPINSGNAVLISCKDDEEAELSVRQQLTSGSWEWIETYYAVRGAQQTFTETPQSTGITMEVTFTSDSVKIYHNNQFVASYPYELVENGINNNSIFVTYNQQNLEPTVESGPIQIENTGWKY